MVRISMGVFRCVLLTPSGKLLDCRAGSLVLPAHDGMRGVLRNHAPMLCKLGTGIMEVRDIPDRKDAFYLIDGGFARIALNLVTVLTYDVTTFETMAPEEAELLISRARSVLVGGGYIRQTEDMDVDRARLLVKMGRLANVAQGQ
ncbi:MAG TPA: F0F1 ATP synthase subunit epsilon [Anaerohalosphaeraceae bacterium]|jgi:F0F1-type ATP synthase epsilon subunit|nr:F0F1 ATP synthase subunit epsilon [Anaerohalosphaeraceae bacterium]HRT50124.1 F0F1 ATP synthase subunit epsilon [Anaerohalosphaeraceae bacterium]HRT86058.1 F0F1 ATP synthase subunit epsilon [Anaerohalosphaeraceae bacterium]